MSSFVEEKDRKIIPRWRSFSRTVARGELDSLGKSPSKSIVLDETFQEKILEWEERRLLPFASEVVAGGIVLGREAEAAEAAHFIISLGDDAPSAVRKVAEQIVGLPSPDAVRPNDDEEHGPAKELRERLSEDPRNSIAWVDLALHYAKVGSLKKARRAMDTAVDLAPDNRFILRSAARFYVHIDDPDRALYILLRSRATPSDPWLIASEIAVQSIRGKTSDLLKAGRRTLESGTHRPLHISELACAIGTLEMEAHGGREARKLFRKALLDPTENSVAQTRWAFHKMGSPEIDPAYWVEKRSFEAHAWASFHGARWSAALSAARGWLRDQPFSTRPAVLASYVAGVWSAEFSESARLARVGLRANPNDPTLTNNLAFALANLNDLKEARETLQQLRNRTGGIEVEVMRLSTAGMIEYRSGKIESGRALYLQAMEKAAGAGLERIRARACVFMAMEEKQKNTPDALKARELAERLSQNVVDPDLRLLVQRLK